MRFVKSSTSKSTALFYFSTPPPACLSSMGNFFWKKLSYLFPTIIGFLIITFWILCVNFFEVRFLEGRCVKMPPPSIFFKIPPPYHPKKSAFSLLFWISQILHPTFFQNRYVKVVFFLKLSLSYEFSLFRHRRSALMPLFFEKQKKHQEGVNSR